MQVAEKTYAILPPPECIVTDYQFPYPNEEKAYTVNGLEYKVLVKSIEFGIAQVNVNGDRFVLSKGIKHDLDEDVSIKFLSIHPDGVLFYCFTQGDVPPDTTLNVDLSDYPSMFFENDVFNGVIVVGDGAAPRDDVVATDILISLQPAYTARRGLFSRIQAGSVKRASEISSLDQNIISVGGACGNTRTHQIEGSPNCIWI